MVLPSFVLLVLISVVELTLYITSSPDALAAGTRPEVMSHGGSSTAQAAMALEQPLGYMLTTGMRRQGELAGQSGLSEPPQGRTHLLQQGSTPQPFPSSPDNWGRSHSNHISDTLLVA